MKKIVFLLLVAACGARGAGTVSQSLQPLGNTGNYALTFYWTGDAVNGTIPVTAANLGTASLLAQGMRILEVEVVPGAPAPSPNYSAQIVDSFGGDSMVGTLINLSSTSTQFFSATSQTPPIVGTFSLSLAGQSVAGATGKVIVYFGPTTLVNATAGATGATGAAGAAGASNGDVLASACNFAAQTPGTALTAGVSATITLTPVPAGVNGADLRHPLWISGGAGAAEAVTITGGTAVGGATSGTVSFTPANSHSGAWTIQSATSGGKECEVANPNGATIAFGIGSFPIHATWFIETGSIHVRGQAAGSASPGGPGTTLLADLSVTPVISVGFINGASSVTIQFTILDRLTISRAAGTVPAGSIGVKWAVFNNASAQSVYFTRHAYGEYLTSWSSTATSIGYNSVDNHYGFNTTAHIYADFAAGLFWVSPYLGINGESVAPVDDIILASVVNDVNFINAEFLSAAQWGVLFQSATSATGFYRFVNCNWEAYTSGGITSDAASTSINALLLDHARFGGSPALPVTSFNAATSISAFQIDGGLLSGTINLTGATKSSIRGAYISGVMTITGGDMTVVGNSFTTSPVFTGSFSNLNLSSNSFTFNNSAIIRPNLTGASGNITVMGNSADGAPAQPRDNILPALGLGLVQTTINGGLTYCSDCDTPTSQGVVCTNVGDKAGAMAMRARGAWRCY